MSGEHPTHCPRCGTELRDNSRRNDKYIEAAVGVIHTDGRCANVLAAREKERQCSRTIICGALNHDGKSRCGHHNYDVCVHVADAAARLHESEAGRKALEAERDTLIERLSNYQLARSSWEDCQEENEALTRRVAELEEALRDVRRSLHQVFATPSAPKMRPQIDSIVRKAIPKIDEALAASQDLRKE